MRLDDPHRFFFSSSNKKCPRTDRFVAWLPFLSVKLSGFYNDIHLLVGGGSFFVFSFFIWLNSPGTMRYLLVQECRYSGEAL